MLVVQCRDAKFVPAGSGVPKDWMSGGSWIDPKAEERPEKAYGHRPTVEVG